MRQASELTVVIPVCDQAEFVADAVASVLGQAGGPPTVVVVDDGSVDSSGEAARKMAPSARVLRTLGLGPAAARNLGVDATTTPFVAFCDADDLWPPDRCQRDLALLASHVAPHDPTEMLSRPRQAPSSTRWGLRCAAHRRARAKLAPDQPTAVRPHIHKLPEWWPSRTARFCERISPRLARQLLL